MTASGDACIGDFGLSRFLQNGAETALIPSSSDGNRAGPWLAIEFTREDGPISPTRKGDVWSFGCIAMVSS